MNGTRQAPAIYCLILPKPGQQSRHRDCAGGSGWAAAPSGWVRRCLPLTWAQGSSESPGMGAVARLQGWGIHSGSRGAGSPGQTPHFPWPFGVGCSCTHPASLACELGGREEAGPWGCSVLRVVVRVLAAQTGLVKEVLREAPEGQGPAPGYPCSACCLAKPQRAATPSAAPWSVWGAGSLGDQPALRLCLLTGASGAQSRWPRRSKAQVLPTGPCLVSAHLGPALTLSSPPP